MFLPTTINFHGYFYPLGNTPAVNLARDEPIPNDGDSEEDRNLRILLLGCGDPRNLMFTVEQEDGRDRKFDFTCCDWEPAVLARNVFLLTFLLGNDKSIMDTTFNTAWNTFHHFFLSQSDLDITQKHAEKLAALAVTLSKWKGSDYGGLIKMVDEHSLEVLRGFWTSWAATKTQSTAENHNFEGRFRADIRQTIEKRRKRFGTITSGNCRTAWLFGPKAPQKVLREVFEGFWQTGVIAGNTADIAALGNGGKGVVNPLFAFSTGKAPVHYATEPSGSYNLSPVFAPGLSSGKGKLNAKMAVANLVKLQFRNRCQAFLRAVNSEKIIIRIFAGDALALCYTIRRLQEPITTSAMIYTQPWTFTPLVMDNQLEIPTSFEVIDTSNIADHVGTLNVLIATAPLVANRPASTLYTETMLAAQKDKTEVLSALLYADVTTLSIILGIAPAGHLHGLSTYNSAAESIFLHSAESQQFLNRVTWKKATGGDPHITSRLIPISVEPAQIAGVLFNIYQKMFDVEGWQMHMLASKPAMKMIVPYSNYLRPGFVALVNFAKQRLDCDWERAMNLLTDKIELYTGSIFNTNYLQELHLHLFLTGSDPSSKLKVRPKEAASKIPHCRTGVDKIAFSGKETPISTIVILVVPRKSLLPLLAIDKDKLVQPQIMPSITQINGYAQCLNMFGLMHCAFGRLSFSDGQLIIDEDEASWYGKSDLIVQFRAPTYNLLYGPQDGIRIGLRAFSANPSISMLIARTLGIQCAIYEADLESENVYLRQHLIKTRKYEEFGQTIIASSPTSSLSNKPDEDRFMEGVEVVLDTAGKTTGLKIKATFDAAESSGKALKAGAAVTTIHFSACSVLVQLDGKHDRVLMFPFPVNASSCKLKVARTSLWIEVTAKPSTATTPGGYERETALFPVVSQGLRPPVTWGLPTINIKALTPLPLSKSDEWLEGQSVLNMSTEEMRQLISKTIPNSAFVEFKRSLQSVFADAASRLGERKGGDVLLNLAGDESLGIDTMLFLKGLRYDLDALSFILEAYYVPLTERFMDDLEPALKKLPFPITQFRFTPEVVKLWKHYLCASAERCRTWSHKDSCEYRQKNAPLSDNPGESPLCSCSIGSSKKIDPKSTLYSFRKYAVQVAISPLFPVAYVERTGGDSMDGLMQEMKTINIGNTKQKQNALLTDKQCNFCKKEKANLSLCARCKAVRYCSQDCQKQDWKAHKQNCKKI